MDFIWVLVVVVVLFGGSQLPKLAKNAGEAMKEFRRVHDEAFDTAQPTTGQPFASQSPASATSQAPTQETMAAAPAPVVPSAPQPGAAVGSPTTVEATSAEQVMLSRVELDALLQTARERVAETAQQPKS
jgi:TatA/E family protein of Tat protein translocase